MRDEDIRTIPRGSETALRSRQLQRIDIEANQAPAGTNTIENGARLSKLSAPSRHEQRANLFAGRCSLLLR